MNVRILGNAMAVQRRNDQKVASRARAKAQHEWENLVAIAKQCPPFPKPGLVKLASEQLLKVLGLTAWGWAVCLEMQHREWRKMKTYKGLFDPPVAHMHDNSRRHGMPNIGIESPIKQVGENSWQLFWIFMNLK